MSVSVVVPVAAGPAGPAQAAGRLRDCLEALRGQTVAGLEVVMVDAGAPAGCAAIAEHLAAVDERFRLVRLGPVGIGAARGAGAARASGRYLAFADPRDALPPPALDLLTAALDRSGSDLATAAAPRQPPARATTVRRRPDLLRDRTTGRTVYRAEFWDAHGLTFLSEPRDDTPIAVAALVLAERIDVVDVGEAAGRRRGPEPADVPDRLAAAELTRAFLREQAAGLLSIFERYVLTDDFPQLVAAYRDAAEPDRAVLLALAAEFLAGAAEPAPPIPARQRLQLHLLGRGLGADLPVPAQGPVRVVREGRRYLADYPFRNDHERSVPDHVYDVTDELRVIGRVEHAEYTPDGLFAIEGTVELAVAGPVEGAGLRLFLRAPRLRRRIRLRVEEGVEPGRFRATVKARRLARRGAARWEVHAEIAALGLRRAARLRDPSEALAVTARLGGARRD